MSGWAQSSEVLLFTAGLLFFDILSLASLLSFLRVRGGSGSCCVGRGNDGDWRTNQAKTKDKEHIEPNTSIFATSATTPTATATTPTTATTLAVGMGEKGKPHCNDKAPQL